MPPWARQPTASYWPATSSPGRSFGSNENGPPHLRQKPAVRPGSPSRPRPTGSLQRPQKRRLSGTIAESPSTASAGSRNGTGGISTSPAPRRPRALVRVRPVVARRAVPVADTVSALGGGSWPTGPEPGAGPAGGRTAAGEAGVG